MSRQGLFERILSPVHLEVNHSQCLKLRHGKSSCRLCLDNCPLGAVNFNEKLEIDYSLCSGCGICVNLCPTGVFELEDISGESLLARVGEDGLVEFNCTSFTQENDSVRVPCLGYLDEAVLIGAIARGNQAVRLNIAQCKKCRFAHGLRAIARSIRQANSILSLFGIPRKISASAEQPETGYTSGEEKLYSRREFFSQFQRKTRSLVATAMANGEGEKTTRTTVTLEPNLPKKRSLLLEFMQALGQPVVDQVKADGLPFAQIEISSNCNGCGVCTTFCPTGALKSCDQGNRQSIDFSLGYCLDCNLCSDICPEGAISYSTHINPYDLVSDQRKVLIEHKKSVCLQCGQAYIAEPGSRLCPGCRKKKGLEEWITTIWKQS